MKVTAAELARVNRAIERACEPHRSAPRCGKWGKPGTDGFSGLCMRAKGHAGTCDPSAQLGDDAADLRFVLGLLAREGVET